MLDKKQIQVIFLFEFKMGPKAAETTHNINNTFEPGTDNLYYSAVAQGVMQRKALKMRSVVASIINWQWPTERIIKADPLTTTTTQDVAKELNVTNFWHLKQIGKVKKLDKWVPHELTASQKSYHFEVSPFLLCNNNKPFFLIRLWHAMKSGSYMTTSDNQLSGWTEKKFTSTSLS